MALSAQRLGALDQRQHRQHGQAQAERAGHVLPDNERSTTISATLQTTRMVQMPTVKLLLGEARAPGI